MLRLIFLAAITLTGCKEPVVVKSYLTLVNISPASGASGVSVDAAIVATFSEDLDPSTVDSQTAYMEDGSQLPVVATVVYDDASRSVMLTPESSLAEGTEYRVTFTRDIAGKQSGALGAVISTTFSTGGGTLQNELPIAAAGEDQESSVGSRVQLDGRQSTDPEGASLSYAWRMVSMPTGSITALLREDAIKTAFIPDLPGEYMVGLTVNDGIEDSSEDFVAIEVSSAIPPEDTGMTDDTGSPEPGPDTGSPAPDTGDAEGSED